MTFYRDDNSMNKMQELLDRMTLWHEVICCCIASVLALLPMVLLKGTKLRKKKSIFWYAFGSYIFVVLFCFLINKNNILES